MDIQRPPVAHLRTAIVSLAPPSGRTRVRLLHASHGESGASFGRQLLLKKRLSDPPLFPHFA